MARIQGLDKVVHDQDHILILGSIASVESLKQGIHYAHPSNRFWKVLSAIYDCPTTTVDQKKPYWKKQELLYGTAVQLVYVKAVVMQVLRKLYQMIFRVS